MTQDDHHSFTTVTVTVTVSVNSPSPSPSPPLFLFAYFLSTFCIFNFHLGALTPLAPLRVDGDTFLRSTESTVHEDRREREAARRTERNLSLFL